jgi:hypothetical protein
LGWGEGFTGIGLAFHDVARPADFLVAGGVDGLTFAFLRLADGADWKVA